MQREDSPQPVNAAPGPANPAGAPPPQSPYVPAGQYPPPQYVPQPPQYAPQGQYPPPPPSYPQQYPPYAPYGQQPPTQAETVPTSGGDRLPMLIVLGGFLLVAVIAALRGELLTFLSIGLEIAPFAVLALLAYSGRKSTTGAVFTYMWLAGLIVALFVNLLVNTLTPFIDQSALNNMAASGGIFASGNLSTVISAGAAAAVGNAMLLGLVALAVSLAMLARPVRAGAARIMPINPDDFVHKIALCIVTFVTLSSFVPMLVLAGEPPLLKAATSEQAAGLINWLSLIYQLVWTIPAALVAAGWPIARNFNTTLARLGVVRPTAKQALMGVGLGFGLALVAGLVIDPVIHFIWQSMGWPTTDTAAFEKLLSNLITPLGAVVIGVTAGIGEELMVRGLLQPRFGIVAAALFFTSLHAFQYSLDGLLSVFIIGCILGVVRARSNTTTSAIVHGVYDFVLVMASVLLAGVAK